MPSALIEVSTLDTENEKILLNSQKHPYWLITDDYAFILIELSVKYQF